MIVGYMRVSSIDQCLDRQLDGIKLDRVYEEKISGKDTAGMPALQSCVDSLKADDALYVGSICLIATNNRELFSFLLQVKSKRADVHFVKDDLFISKNEDLSLFEKLKDFEAAAVKERQAIGREKARKNGKQIGAKRIPKEKQDEIKRRRSRGDEVKNIAKKMKLSISTIYNYI